MKQMGSRRTFVIICSVVFVACGGMNLSLRAYADPPPWAPAHGWRAHHERGDREDDGPRVIYAPPAIVFAPPAIVYAPPPVAYLGPSALNIIIPLR